MALTNPPRCLDIHAHHIGTGVVDRVNAEGAQLNQAEHHAILWGTGARLLGLDH